LLAIFVDVFSIHYYNININSILSKCIFIYTRPYKLHIQYSDFVYMSVVCAKENTLNFSRQMYIHLWISTRGRRKKGGRPTKVNKVWKVGKAVCVLNNFHCSFDKSVKKENIYHKSKKCHKTDHQNCIVSI